MFIDKQILGNLPSRAKQNSRFGHSYDLRTTLVDKGQRILNTLEPGIIMSNHFHRIALETMVKVSGKYIERFYDDNGNFNNELEWEP